MWAHGRQISFVDPGTLKLTQVIFAGGRGVLCNILLCVDFGLDQIKVESKGSVFMLCQPLSQEVKHNGFPEETITDLWENGNLVTFCRC